MNQDFNRNNIPTPNSTSHDMNSYSGNSQINSNPSTQQEQTPNNPFDNKYFRPEEVSDIPKVFETNDRGVPQHVYEEPKKTMNNNVVLALVITGGLILVAVIIAIVILAIAK